MRPDGRWWLVVHEDGRAGRCPRLGVLCRSETPEGLGEKRLHVLGVEKWKATVFDALGGDAATASRSEAGTHQGRARTPYAPRQDRGSPTQRRRPRSGRRRHAGQALPPTLSIERVFLHLTTKVRCEVHILSNLPAALFALACTVAFNVQAVLKAVLRASYAMAATCATWASACRSSLMCGTGRSFVLQAWRLWPPGGGGSIGHARSRSGATPRGRPAEAGRADHQATARPEKTSCRAVSAGRRTDDGCALNLVWGNRPKT